MTDEEIKKIAYEPLGEAWKVIHMTQHLKPNDDTGWKEYEKAYDEFCKKYGSEGYGYHLGMAILSAVDEIAKGNR